MGSVSAVQKCKMEKNDDTCDAFSEFVVGDGSTQSVPVGGSYTSRRDALQENTHYSSIHRAYSSLDFANFSNVRRHKSVDDPRFIWTKQDSADIRVLVDQHVKLRKQFAQLQKLDASAFDGVTEYREAGMNALPERDIETYGLESRANITKFRKGFELYLKRRDRLTKIITDLSTDLEMMKHVRLIQNKEIKRQVKTKMQKIIDGLFVDPATIQIEQRDLKYENVYFGKYDLIGSVGITSNEFMTDFKKSINLDMDSHDEVKMYRWLSDAPQHVLLIEWRICEVSRDNYETINFGLSEILHGSYVYLPKYRLQAAAYYQAYNYRQELKNDHMRITGALIVTFNLSKNRESGEITVKTWGNFYNEEDLTVLADDFNNIVSVIKDDMPDDGPINVTRALKIHFKEPDDPKSRLKVRRVKKTVAKSSGDWRF